VDPSVVLVLRIGYLQISAPRGRHLKLNVYQAANENVVAALAHLRTGQGVRGVGQLAGLFNPSLVVFSCCSG